MPRDEVRMNGHRKPKVGRLTLQVCVSDGGGWGLGDNIG